MQVLDIAKRLKIMKLLQENGTPQLGTYPLVNPCDGQMEIAQSQFSGLQENQS